MRMTKTKTGYFSTDFLTVSLDKRYNNPIID